MLPFWTQNTVQRVHGTFIFVFERNNTVKKDGARRVLCEKNRTRHTREHERVRLRTRSVR